MERYVCIHGHFYQPPRENPWLEAIELQDSAYPYHDWNERIAAECYSPNGASRMLDPEGRIQRIVNNYSRISFNFGPTLLAWMEEGSPGTYQAILAADRESAELFSGHGSALAQSYGHTILPLSNRRDKYSQVLWGIRDFEYRFGRKPEGMWLPEAAVDSETLDILAELGIRFTVLSPYQARRVRRVGARNWKDVSHGRIDPSRTYKARLSSGRSINLLFYDGPISQAVAFEGLLSNGEQFANRILNGFAEGRNWPQLVHIATDGESYGHHHRHGEMALTYALHHIESNNLARLTNYGEYLEKHPPTHEVEVFEASSWSCAHGVERWRSDCGCNSGGYPSWNQQWRTPLREALDWLRGELAPRYEQLAGQLVENPWTARDDYISVILDRSPESRERFVARHAARDLSPEEMVTLWKLLEIQRHAMLMYTSCGWFFDELSGIESVQVIEYASRAIQLAEDVFGVSIEPRFLELLGRAKSNLPAHGDGALIYQKRVKPAAVDLLKVGAHYAVSSLFETYADKTGIYCYTVDEEDYHSSFAGEAKMAVGRIQIASEVTQESDTLSFGVLGFGGYNLTGGVRPFRGEEPYQAMAKEMSDAFTRGDLPEELRLLDKHFGDVTYSLKSLFRDEQRKILHSILESTLAEAEAVYRQVYEHRAPLMRFLADAGTPMPKALYTAAEMVVGADLRRAFETELLDHDRIMSLLEEAARWQFPLDPPGLSYTLKLNLEGKMARFRADPSDLVMLQQLDTGVKIATSLPFEVDLWKVQNIYYEMLQGINPEFWGGSDQGEEVARDWIDRFASLGEKLGVRVAELRANPIRAAPGVVALAEEITAQRRIPAATYRLQFNKDFTFRDAQAIVPYLDDLGISDCYASPIFKATPGSSHGYDVCDHTQLNPELCGEESFDALSSALRARSMGLILDMVPNHMGIAGGCNPWWMDVLENGPISIYASFFDIDWRPLANGLRDKVLLPILEDQYGKVLEGGNLRLAYESGAFYICHHQTKLPVAPRTYATILNTQLGPLTQVLGPEHGDVRELQSILTALGYLPSRSVEDPEKRAERNREKEVIKGRIDALYQSSPHLQAAIDAAVQLFNGTTSDPASFDLLDQLLDNQPYRPAYWRVAAEEINYRRFFDINDLAAIRVERPEVFRATHQLVFDLLRKGKATGLRIDHPDGLWNPPDYFRRLQESYVAGQIRDRLGRGVVAARMLPPEDSLDSAVAAWFHDRLLTQSPSEADLPLYVVAEKILSKGERLPRDWAVQGTTGYDFINDVNGLFVDGGNASRFDDLYGRFVGADINFRNLANSTKKMIMLISLASELNALAHQLDRITEGNRWYRDFTLNSLTFALREVIACLPVYRTYITGLAGSTDAQDRTHVEAAVAEAKRRNPRTAATIFDFIRDVLLLRNVRDFPEEDRGRLLDFVMKFQQLTGPVMAKGVEDTAFYVYNRLVSLNEVGGYPDQFGISVEAFHARNAERQRDWPHTLLASSTHDTKRGEDVRARIDVLSEMPDDWQAALGRWSDLNAPRKLEVNGEPAPDRNDEYLLYQTLLGAWPNLGSQLISAPHAKEYSRFRQRIASYMQKATKEAKVHTSWVNPNEQYDAAMEQFVLGILPDDGRDPFLADLLALEGRVAFYGRFNSLSELLLKLASPGVPDFYQGSELWNLSLVDPDNRRPVDYGLRSDLLSELKGWVESAEGGRAEGSPLGALARELLASSQDGRIKLYVTYRALRFRGEHPQLFSEGDYLPLAAMGEKGKHVVAFARGWGEEAVLAAAPRLVVGLTGGEEAAPVGGKVWKDARLILPPEELRRRYRNLFTGEVLSVEASPDGPCLPLAAVFGHFPVALMERLPG